MSDQSYLRAVAREHVGPIWAEDAAQEAAIALWKAGLSSVFEHGGKIIAQREIIDFRRRLYGRHNQRHAKLQTYFSEFLASAEDHDIYHGTVGAESPADRLLGHVDDSLEAVATFDLIARLPERLRQIVAWLLQGYPQKWIAEQLGISESRVSQLRKQAHRQLVAA